jgi:alkyl hydroperoxide reductase subunit AhpF
MSVAGEKDYGIRFLGISAGYKFVSLIGSIELASRGESGLSEEIWAALGPLRDDIHIQVFIALTCPYCPGAVEIAHKLALESELVTADMVESAEFPHQKESSSRT